MTLQELMQTALDIAIKDVESSADTISKFLAEYANGGLGMYVCPWRDERDKALILAKLKADFAERGVERYVLVSEVWAADHVDGDPRMPKDRPDRRESLQVIGVEHGAARSVECAITQEGGKRRCGPPQWDQFTISHGRMVSLLPERRMAS